jgi:hypothetical protein
VGFALWTRVGVMRGRARLCPVLASDTRAGTVVARGDWGVSLDGIEEESDERRRRSSWRGGDIKINGMTR